MKCKKLNFIIMDKCLLNNIGMGWLGGRVNTEKNKPALGDGCSRHGNPSIHQ